MNEPSKPDSEPASDEREIFLAAASMSDGVRRAEYLKEKCGDDQELKGRIESLLHSDVDTLDLFDSSTSITMEEVIEDPALVSGTRIQYFGDYELLEEVASGAMGVVWRAKQVTLKRVVALKMIKSSLLASDQEVQRFRLEAEAAAGLNHPNIVPIYEIGEHEGQHFFSMKLIEGGTLASHHEAFRSDRKKAVELMILVARAVDAAHRAGVLHRDLKPGNILIDEEGMPHITDFGLAKQIDAESELTMTGQIMGTPHYMSPEQARGANQSTTTSTDVYGLGAILFELLAGQRPFQDDSLMGLLQKVLVEIPKPLRLVDSSIDRDLETIVEKCLAKEPESRYRTAEELARDLEFWREGAPITARPIGRAERILKWAKRKPVHAALGGLMAVFLLTVGIGGPLVAVRQADLTEEAILTLADMNRNAGLKEESEALAAMYFAKAAELSKGDPERALANRTRAEQWSRDLWIPVRGFQIQRTVRNGYDQNGHIGATEFLFDRHNRFLIVGTNVNWEWPRMESRLYEVWNLATEKPVQDSSGNGIFTAAAFSGDGRWLAISSGEGRIEVQPLAEEGAVAKYETGLPQVSVISFHSDEKKLGFAGGFHSGILDLDTGELGGGLWRSGGVANWGAFSPDGSHFVVTSTAATSIFDLSEGAIYPEKSVEEYGFELKVWSKSIQVAALAPGSAAEEAGLLLGDVITHVNDVALSEIPRNRWNAEVIDSPNGMVSLKVKTRTSKARTVTLQKKRSSCRAATHTVEGARQLSTDQAPRFDGNDLITFTRGKMLRWDCGKGERMSAFEIGQNIAVSPDLKMGVNDSSVFELESREVTQRIEGYRGYERSCFSPDGSLVIKGHDSLRAFRRASWKAEREFEYYRVAGLGWSSDGLLQARGTRFGMVRVFQTWKKPDNCIFPTEKTTIDYQMSPDGEYLILHSHHTWKNAKVTSFATARVRFAKTGDPAGPSLPVNGHLMCAEFDGDAVVLGAGSLRNRQEEDSQKGFVRKVHWRTAEPMSDDLVLPAEPRAISRGPEGEFYILCANGDVCRTPNDLSSYTLFAQTRAPAQSGTDCDGKLEIHLPSNSLVVDSSAVFDLVTGEKVWVGPGQRSTISGNLLALANREVNNDLTLFRLDTRKQLEHSMGHSGNNGVGIDAEAGRMILATVDGQSRVYDVEENRILGTPFRHLKPAQGASFVPNSPWVVSVDATGNIFFWDPRTGRAVAPAVFVRPWEAIHFLTDPNGEFLIAGPSRATRSLDLNRFSEKSSLSRKDFLRFVSLNADASFDVEGIAKSTEKEWLENWKSFRTDFPRYHDSFLNPSKEDVLAHYRTRALEESAGMAAPGRQNVDDFPYAWNLRKWLECDPDSSYVQLRLLEHSLLYEKLQDPAKQSEWVEKILSDAMWSKDLEALAVVCDALALLREKPEFASVASMTRRKMKVGILPRFQNLRARTKQSSVDSIEEAVKVMELMVDLPESARLRIRNFLLSNDPFP